MTILARVLLVLVMGLVLAACPAANQGGDASPSAAQTDEPEESEEPEETDDEGGDRDGVSVFTLSAGECLNLIDEATNTVEAVDCEGEHEYEIYAVLEAGEEDDEYPEADELTDLAEECTNQEFEEYVGGPYADSPLYSIEVQPTEEEWEDGVREIVCVLYDPENETTSGSAEGSETGGAEESEEPSETDASGDFPNADEEHLLSHIPGPIRGACGETDFGVVGTATVGCSIGEAGGDISITYNSFETEEEMYESYDRNLEFMRVERDAGSCTGEWPGEGTYNLEDETAGRAACAILEGIGDPVAIISWTDDELLIKGYAEGFGVDQQAFYEWWANEAGPLPEAEAGD